MDAGTQAFDQWVVDLRPRSLLEQDGLGLDTPPRTSDHDESGVEEHLSAR